MDAGIHEVLETLEKFHIQSIAVFDRVEAACSAVDTRLGALEGRLVYAADRLTAAKGDARPLVVHSARSLSGRSAMKTDKRVLDDGMLVGLGSAAPLPEKVGSVPSVTEAAEDLTRVVRSLAPDRAAASAVPRKGGNTEKLLNPKGRLGSVTELFLYNSGELPYKNQRETDNLASPDDENDLAAAPARAERRDATEAALITDLEEDEPEPHQENIHFAPQPAKEVYFDLPDILPDLGGPVADMMWRQNEQSNAETDKFGGSKHMAAIPRRQSNFSQQGQSQGRRSQVSSQVGSSPAGAPWASAAKNSDSPATLSSLPSVPIQAPAPARPSAAPSAPTPAAPAAQPAATTAPAAPAPPKKGAGKGKPPGPPGGKAKSGAPGPPPPPSKGPPKTKAAAPPGGGGGKAAMMSAIQKGTGLKKVGPPKERGAPLGRVL